MSQSSDSHFKTVWRIRRYQCCPRIVLGSRKGSNMKATGALALSLTLAATSCTAGPSHLVRTVDDWQNKGYAENPVLTGVISDVLPAYAVLKVFAAIPDYLILNPIQFWTVDLWKGKGSAFQHSNPEATHRPWYYKELKLGD
jgi:hypothetical protein